VVHRAGQVLSRLGEACEPSVGVNRDNHAISRVITPGALTIVRAIYGNMVLRDCGVRLADVSSAVCGILPVLLHAFEDCGRGEPVLGGWQGPVGQP
jgi:hypothetical protein